MRVRSTSNLEQMRKRIIKYVTERQTSDGGYFFACVPPGSLLDTYYAIKTLNMLETKPPNIELTEDFVNSFQSDYQSGNIHALFLATEVLSTLGKSVATFYKFGKSALERFNVSQFENYGNLDIDVTSELKPVYESVVVFTNLKIDFQKTQILKLVLALFNKDGGFGRNRNSTLSTTFYALKILFLLNSLTGTQENVAEFLAAKRRNLFFIEEFYYWLGSCFIIGKNLPESVKEEIAHLIWGYQRVSGGFARSRAIGIATLEYTYYAVSMLKVLGQI